MDKETEAVKNALHKMAEEGDWCPAAKQVLVHTLQELNDPQGIRLAPRDRGICALKELRDYCNMALKHLGE